MEVDPDAVVAAALSCPEVAAMSSGLGEVATYLPGRRVPGVRLTDREVEIHVVARWEANLPQAAESVRRAVAPLTGGLPTSVYIEDIELPGTSQPPPAVAPSEGDLGAHS